MGMDKDILGPELGLAIKSAIDSLSDEEASDREILFNAMGDAIAEKVIDHIQQYATVSTIVTGTDSNGGAVTGEGKGSPPDTGVS